MATLKSIKNKYLVPADGTVLGVTKNTENISLLSFKLATADSLTKFNMVDGFTDDYNDATGVDAGASTNGVRNAANYYSGIVSPTGGLSFRYMRVYITSADYYDANAGAHVFFIEDYNDAQYNPTAVYTNAGGPWIAQTYSTSTGSWWYTNNTSNAQNGYGDWGEIKTGIDTLYIGKHRTNGDPTQMKVDVSSDNSNWTVVDFSSATYATGGGTDFTISGGNNSGFFTLSAYASNGLMGYKKIMLNNSTAASYNNMTLVSGAFTAQAAPTTTRIILDEEPVTGNTTLNTDIKAYASRDGGTTFTQITLAKQADILNTGGIDANTKLLISCNGTNGGSTFTDTSGEGATITKSGDPTTVTTQWKFNGSSMYLDGNDYLNITPEIFNDNDPFTIDFWVRGDNFGSSADWEHLVAISDTAGTGDILGVAVDTSGVLKVNHYSQDLDSGFTLAANTWYHIAACYDGVTQYVFVDGDLKASNTGYTYTLDGLPILIGARGWSPPIGSMFTGYMNEIRISTVARWTAGFTPPVTPYSSGTYVEPRRLLSGSIDISGQPAGTSMKYKITTHNQAAAKQTRVYGTSMAWA